MTKLSLLLAMISLVPGCAMTDPDVGVDEAPVTTTNGVRLNGVRLNGVRLNGVALNGVRLNGVRLNGVRLNGVALGGETLSGSVITAVENGVTVPPQELLGSTWEGRLSDGSILPVRLDTISRGEGTNVDVAMYGFSYQTTTGWVGLCDLGDGSPPPLALAVQGTWNYNEGVTGGGSYDATAADITLACRGVAIAKCVEMGYKPWRGKAAYLAACTRALRADYCGNGTPYTADGTTINIYDTAGLQLDTEAWDPEASWNANGAVCIKRTNRAVEVLSTRPACITTLTQTTCPTLKSTTLIKTELPPLT